MAKAWGRDLDAYHRDTKKDSTTDTLLRELVEEVRSLKQLFLQQVRIPPTSQTHWNADFGRWVATYAWPILNLVWVLCGTAAMSLSPRRTSCGRVGGAATRSPLRRTGRRWTLRRQKIDC